MRSDSLHKTKINTWNSKRSEGLELHLCRQKIPDNASQICLHRHTGMCADDCVAAVQPAASRCPPDICIWMVQIWLAIKKSAVPIGTTDFLELLARFELATGSNAVLLHWSLTTSRFKFAFGKSGWGRQFKFDPESKKQPSRLGRLIFLLMPVLSIS